MDYTKESTQLALQEFFTNDYYKKSNIVITSKYRSTPLENKIMAIAMANIQNAEEDASGALTLKMKASSLIKLINGNSGSFYNQLSKTARAMTGRTIGMDDPEQGRFVYMAVITTASYDNGVFTIELNRHLKKYFKNIAQNFTLLKLETMLSLDSAYTQRIYELLKSKAYTPKGVPPKNKFLISFGLAELKLEIGVVNAELDSVRKILNNSKDPDYEKAVSASPERMFDNWTDFRRKVLEVAIKEINEKTDLNVTYETKKTGKGGKVYQVDFYVEILSDIVEKVEEELTDDEKDNILDEISELIEEKLKVKDYRSIAEAANYNLEKIKQAYEVMKISGCEIKNVVGFLISAIEKEYEVTSVEAKSNPHMKVLNTFTDFEQRTLDFDGLEEKLLSRK